jgi:hypothetical protein
MNTHPSGINLTPESIKIIENVHYLVTHNLPVQRYVINYFNKNRNCIK